MKQKLRMLFVALLMILLSACLCFGVTVPGHDGTQLALSQIGDIIRHVTGKTSGDLRFEKESLYMMKHSARLENTNAFAELTGSVCSFDYPSEPQPDEDLPIIVLSSSANERGNVYRTAFTNNHEGISLNSSSNYQHSAAVKTSSVRSSDKGKLLLNFASDNNGNLLNEAVYLIRDNSSENVSFDHSGTMRAVGNGVTGIFLDAKAGINVKGFNGELIACLMRNDSAISLFLAKVKADEKPASSYAESVSGSWPSLITLNSESVPKMSDGTSYFPASMAAGDFDYDGYSDNIAVAWSDIDHVYVKAFKISYDTNSGNYSLKEIYSSTVHDYEYSSIGIDRNRGKDMDGVSTTYCASVAAGDFDGDHNEEFAVVFRDNKPDDYSLYYASHVVQNANTNVIDGLTGAVNAVVHKWDKDNNTFRTAQARKSYNSYNDENSIEFTYQEDQEYAYHNQLDYNVLFAVKAVAADINGRGRDDLAVLMMCASFGDIMNIRRSGEIEGRLLFGIHIDIAVWSFDDGNIEPKPGKSFTAEYFDPDANRSTPPIYATDGHFTRSMFLELITRQRTPYPFFEHECDIAAGKFTGRLGDVITVDDIIIKHPCIKKEDSNCQVSDSDNKIYSALSLVVHYNEDSSETKLLEDFSSDGRNCAIAFTASDFIGESVTLGDPVKVTDASDRDYTAVLQMFPYHVDNLTSDGTALQKDPQNFTLRLGTAITYSNTYSSIETKNLTYSMTKVAETIFALDCPGLRSTTKTFQGIRGILTAGIGSNDLIKKADRLGKIWDKLKDTVEDTTSKSNETSQSYTMTITTQANYQDTLYMNKSTRYLWRYPVQQIPAPAWLMGQTKDTMGSFDKSQVTNQQSYITFAMSEPLTPVSSVGVNDSYYQPYHERGNLFSYPAALEQAEGYKGGTSIADEGFKNREWNGADYEETITLTSTVTSQDQTKKINKIGAVTKFLSAADNLFGSNLAQIPQNSDSSFTRSVTNGETIKIKVPAANSGAGFTVRFDTYLDEAGTMTTAFAVTDFQSDDALWGKKSLYSLKPDPSLLLPEKFNYTTINNSDWDRSAFTTNTNDYTAMKMRGVRFTLSDYDIDTNNILLKGLKYTISVPVYNASFKYAENFKVRLSYAKTNDYNAQKTTIGDYTFTKLPGWDYGNNRQTATFTWTPSSMDEGIYCLFAEIDPENVLDEVHENRRDAKGNLIDAGGNNMGYWRIGIAASDSPVFDRNQLENAEFHAADSEGFVFPYVHWVKADGLDLEDFIKQKVDGASEPVPAEVELKYGGDYLMTKANLVGYKLKPEARGKDILEVTDADIGLVFVDAKFAFFPGDDHKLHFRINPAYLEDGIGFVLHVHGEDYPLTDIIYSSAGSNTGVSSSSSGCESFAGSMAGVLALILIMKKRTR